MLKLLRRLFGKKRSFAFHGANTGRLTGDWSSSPTPINLQVRHEFVTLIARVRDLARNNDYVRRWLSLVRSNVVGPSGVSIQSRVPSRNKNGGIDDKASEAVEEAWTNWGRYGVPDVTGKHSWVSLQNTFITDVMRDGEALFRLNRAWNGNEFGFALKRLDVMALPIDYEREFNGNQILMGVELNADDRPVAYHLLQQRASDRTYFHNGGVYERIPADQIIHAFLPEFAYQTRGVSPMTSAMLRLQMLGGYEEASVTKARMAASVMGFFTRSDEGIGFGSQEGTNADGSLVMGVEPGVFKELPAGVSLDTFDPNAPHEQYGEFVKATLRGIASGLGVSYNSLSNDLENVNFSSIRAGVLEDREAWKCLQQWMIDVFCRPIREEWTKIALINSAIKINGQAPRSEPQRYMKASYQGRRWAWVDPLKDAKASQVLLNQRLTTRANLIRDMGLDPKEVWEELAEEEQLLEELGIPAMNVEVGNGLEAQGVADA